LKEVKKNPRNLKDIRKFISYYLPTLSYLLQQYTEMDTKDDTFSNVSLTKEKIKNMLKTVEEAFRQQYNSLFEDEVTDVSVEIKVLENMMAQEGLIKEKEVLH
ncbi:MAG: 5-bromo-4-chloroindolyl phosphate hydrolysis family protein, partial [Erysipelotrichaceae bacterium]|nr:5-bromo-4-chloroindolyl phosphate hydrolysis family protein [Erysipelotrichaceae bacterium]